MMDKEQKTRWETDNGFVEIRTQGLLPDGASALDEVVAQGAFLHLEQMSHDHWWMGIEAAGRLFHLNIRSLDGRLEMNLSDQTDDTSREWEGNTRPLLEEKVLPR